MLGGDKPGGRYRSRETQGDMQEEGDVPGREKQGETPV